MEQYFNQQIQHKARDIKLLILDVDGVLTNGQIYYGTQQMEMKAFHVHDGLGIALLQKSGVTIAIISAKASEAVTQRLKHLKINHIFLGHEDKLPAYDTLKQTLCLTDAQIAFMGDDLIDLPILRRVGLAITVPQAPNVMHQYVHVTTQQKGGKGAVREVCDMLMQAQGTYDAMVQSYVSR